MTSSTPAAPPRRRAALILPLAFCLAAAGCNKDPGAQGTVAAPGAAAGTGTGSGAGSGGSDSFMEFVVAVARLPGVHKDESGTKIVQLMQELGVQFKGKPIDRRFAYSILAVIGFVTDPAAKNAMRLLRRARVRQAVV